MEEDHQFMSPGAVDQARLADLEQADLEQAEGLVREEREAELVVKRTH